MALYKCCIIIIIIINILIIVLTLSAKHKFKKLAPYGTDGRLLQCLQSVLPVSVEKLPKAETSFYGFFLSK